MDEILRDETFLARWLAGELTPEELESFENHPHYNQYKELAERSGQLSLKTPDAKRLFEEIQNRKSVQKPARVVMRRTMWISVAAALLLLVSAYFILIPYNSTIATSPGDQFLVQLDDGTKVNVNGNSILKYNHHSYDYRRIIDLEGEAFFEVSKGSPFKIKTPTGEIRVLGTSFNIIARDKVLTVSCRTGSVEVDAGMLGSAVLDAGKRIRISVETFELTQDLDTKIIGSWKDGNESVFQSTPLIDVISAIESQFGVDIEYSKDVNTIDLVTGSFTHSDLDKALKMVIIPMGLTYEKQSEGLIRIR